MRTRVKICCIKSVEEAWIAINSGASALGLVSEMPSGPGVITEEEIAQIVPAIPPGVASFLLTSKQDVESIIKQQKYTKANTIQLCDRLLAGAHKELREALPGIKIVQVIHVRGEQSITEAKDISDSVDAILLDSGNQSLPVKTLGGTGQVHDWNISKIIRETVSVPVFLAGGLNPENVRQAIERVNPYGIDLCNGIRTAGNIDEQKLAKFMNNIKDL